MPPFQVVLGYWLPLVSHRQIYVNCPPCILHIVNRIYKTLVTFKKKKEKKREILPRAQMTCLVLFGPAFIMVVLPVMYIVNRI